MPDFLLELFSEEIPARMQTSAAQELLSRVSALLTGAGINAGSVKTYVTPRRVSVLIAELPEATPDISEELKGPKVGAPAQALEGFLRKTGLSEAQLTQRDGVYFAKVEQKGRKTRELLSEKLPEVIASIPWPKSMRWGNYEMQYVRPLQRIVCLLGSEVVPFSVGHIQASNITLGHRFLAPQEIVLNHPSDYEKSLHAAYVIADADARKSLIRHEAMKMASQHGLSVIDNPGLLEEVTGLVEWPVALLGTIDAHYMDLPPEVLISEMRAHQKYFALSDQNGKLAPHFIVISNMKTADHGKAIVSGNERVLRARFADGAFFWAQDQKKTLDAWAEGLSSVTYHAKLGSIANKVKRVTELAETLTQYVKGADKKQVRRAAQLCKADLLTGMVGEFPELQGVMGRYYAQKAKEPEAIADAIRDHYKPLGPTDAVPNQPVSICVALADKLDTLTSMFSIGEKPTGSKDPFALRRAALGIIRIVLENELRLPLKKAASASDEMLAFFIDRLKVQLKEQGIRHDVIGAVTATGDDDLLRIVARAKALQTFLESHDGTNLLAAYKRAANILAIEEKKDKTKYDQKVTAKELQLDEEKDLQQALSQTETGIQPLLEKEQYEAVMSALSKLRAPVDIFFDKVLVNDKDPEIRAKRLALLSNLGRTMNAIADFSKIEG